MVGAGNLTPASRPAAITAGGDDYGILLADDFLQAVWSIGQPQPQNAASSSGSSNKAVLQAFVQHVLPACTDAHIEAGRLLQLLGSSAPAAAASSASQRQDAALSALLSAGVLSRHSHRDGCYTICVPGVGAFVKQLVAGRKELGAMLARRK